MLERNLTVAALFARSDIQFTIDICKRRLGLLTSYKYNIEVKPPFYLYSKVLILNERIDNLKLLNNLLHAAVGMLKEKYKNFIKLVYFQRLPKEEIMRCLDIDAVKYRNYKRAAIEKLSLYLHIFGLTNEKFYKIFNEEPLLVRCYENVLEFAQKTNNIGRMRV